VIDRVADQVRIAQVLTEWVWIRQADGRPTRVPSDLQLAFASATD
jgi:hypothetical protein